MVIKLQEVIGMQIGEVIRTHRKNKNMTQEEMANRLGVTPPAVNKWEKNNSLPDIKLLAPIARLLDITLDTLLSFQEELTDDEINGLINEVDIKLKNESYEETFEWAKKQLELYPNCERLTLWMAQIFDIRRCILDISDPEKYDNYINDCYVRVLSSKDEDMKSKAADSLFGFYLRKEEFEKAESYLNYFSNQDPERKRKQAVIYSKTKRVKEAYKSYEELLLSGYEMASLVLNSIYMLAMEEKNIDKAYTIVEKQKQLANLFEMGEYREVSSMLEFVVAQKDIDKTIETMEKLLASVSELDAFSKSSLYEHMVFRPIQSDILEEFKADLLKNFRDKETFAFLENDIRWRELVK